MRGLYGKITKYSAEKIRKAYLCSHPYCCRPVKVNSEWRFCRRRGVLHVNEIAHGSMRIIHTSNLYVMCGWPTGDCHLGYFHEGHGTDETIGRRMMRLFAVKALFAEAVIDEIKILMRGRRWWQPGMGTLEDEIEKLKNEMKSLMDTELERWQIEKRKYVSKLIGEEHGKNGH